MDSTSDKRAKHAAYMREYYRKHSEKILRRCSDYRKNNPEKVAARNVSYYQRNKGKIREYFKQWFVANREKAMESCGRWAKENPEKRRACALQSYYRNREKRLVNQKEWREANKDKMSMLKKLWRQQNLERHAATEARRRAKRLVPIDFDANPSLISVFYEIAKRVGQCLGIEHHVDHIVPLSKGGLHHQLNLQVMPGILNLRKNARL